MKIKAFASTVPRVVLSVSSLLLLWISPECRSQDAKPQNPSTTNPGQFFKVEEPITSETLERIRVSTRQVIDRYAVVGERPVFVFEIRPSENSGETSDFFACYSLASFLSTKLEGAKRTVAYVPQSLSGPASLLPFACDEIVMGTEATLGPITPEGEEVDAAHRENVRILAERKGKDPNLLAGLLDRDLDLRWIQTTDRQLRFVAPDQLEDFKSKNAVLTDKSAWEDSSRGVLTAKHAREVGAVHMIADTAAEVASAYHFDGQSTADDPTLGRKIIPVWIPVEGPIDIFACRKIGFRIQQAIRDDVNLIFFKFDCRGGSLEAADALADLIAGLKDRKTVAYIEDQALGVAALPALACTDIVMRKGSKFGEVVRANRGRGKNPEALDERDIQVVSRRAAQLADAKGRPSAVAVAMIDPTSILVEATDARTGARAFALQSQVDLEPERYLNPIVRKSPGEVLTVSSEEASGYGLGQEVADAEDCKAIYGLRGKTIREDGPGPVDSFVAFLTDPIVSWLLLFVGLFMLVLELKLPGIGLPAITSCLAFLLFFWSRYLSGTADQLEIILFLIGMCCLALELFVFPGFGVFGMSGVLLVLTSIVLASHSFAWPTQDHQYREMGFTLIQVMGAMVAVAGGAIVVARYFPSMPVFNRLVLKPEPWIGNGEPLDPESKPSMEGYDSLMFLIGESGRTTTMLRPSGKAKFGDMLVDVKTEGDFIEPNCLVEVVDVQGHRVIVKQLDI